MILSLHLIPSFLKMTRRIPKFPDTFVSCGKKRDRVLLSLMYFLFYFSPAFTLSTAACVSVAALSGVFAEVITSWKPVWIASEYAGQDALGPLGMDVSSC